MQNPRSNYYESQVVLPAETRQMILNKRRLRRIWQTTRIPLDKANFNRASNLLKRRLFELKNYETATFLQRINYNSYSLWKATRDLKRPVKKMHQLKMMMALGAERIKTRRNYSLNT